MSHTPGNWDWFHSPQWGASIETPDARIANVLRHGGVDHIANATLIAASPQLLAACQAVLANPNDAAWKAMRSAVAEATAVHPADREHEQQGAGKGPVFRGSACVNHVTETFVPLAEDNLTGPADPKWIAFAEKLEALAKRDTAEGGTFLMLADAARAASVAR